LKHHELGGDEGRGGGREVREGGWSLRARSLCKGGVRPDLMVFRKFGRLSDVWGLEEGGWGGKENRVLNLKEKRI